MWKNTHMKTDPNIAEHSLVNVWEVYLLTILSGQYMILKNTLHFV